LLPVRYRLAEFSKNVNFSDETTSWHCETQELQSSTFFFQGRERVTQPSIIQTFELVRWSLSSRQVVLFVPGRSMSVDTKDRSQWFWSKLSTKDIFELSD
jgi:hypothetical protein